jgi:hypothetical protein
MCNTYTFRDFLGNTLSMVLILSHAHATMRMNRVTLYHFFSESYGNTKNEPYGVSFKIFSNSLKMKILLSDLGLFTLLKVFEKMSDGW